MLGRGAHELQNPEKLVAFGGAWEEREAGVELSDDGSDGEEVHRGVVVAASEQGFGSPVPPGRDILGEGRLGPDFPRQPQVRQLYRAVYLQQILWLHVPVEISLPVHVSKGLQGLEGNVPDLKVRQLALLLQHLKDIAVQILEDEVELIILLDKFKELDNVRVVQFGENADFVEADALVPISVLLLHALDGHELACLLVDGLHDRAERAVSQLAAQFIFLHSI